MTVAAYISKLKNTPQEITFPETIAVIEANYTFTPTSFQNGNQRNAAGENSGSCKLFAFAKAQQLTQQETLACFGAYYFDDVLKNPEGTDHQNIRNFILHGWEGIAFEDVALELK